MSVSLLKAVDHFTEWCFAQDEGGTRSIISCEENYTLAVFTGPDCDMTRTEHHKRFVPLDGHAEGSIEHTGRYRYDEVLIHTDDPQMAHWDALMHELGGAIYCHEEHVSTTEWTERVAS